MMLAQPRYQDGFSAGAALRALRLGGLRPTTPTIILPPPAPVVPLTFEERAKQTLHPLDAWPRLLEAAAANRPPGPEDAFRFRWFGLSDLAPKKDGFRLRLRLPGGRLTSAQIRAVADVAQEFASGCAEINEFAGLDIETLSLRDAPEALQRLEAAGLTVRGTGGDTVCALLADPLAGIDPNELLDIHPLVQQLAEQLATERKFSDLPGEVSLAFSGGSAEAERLPGDVYLRAVRAESGNDHTAGTYFRVWLNGAKEDLGALLPPDDGLRFCLELLEVYRRLADRSERAGARFFAFADRCGSHRMLEETERLFARTLVRVQSLSIDAALAKAADESTMFSASVLPHKRVGNGIRAIVPLGRRLLSGEWHELADTADRLSNGEVRLTVAGQVFMPGVTNRAV